MLIDISQRVLNNTVRWKSSKSNRNETQTRKQNLIPPGDRKHVAQQTGKSEGERLAPLQTSNFES